MTNQFKQQFIKGLEDLKLELSLFKNESDLWKVWGNISNSSGNLTLHLIGNLNHFIGGQLVNTGYIRNRENEFSEKNISRENLNLQLENTIKMIDHTFSNLNDEDLKKKFSLSTFGENKSIAEVLVILIGHFNYHLGQINYCRRLI